MRRCRQYVYEAAERLFKAHTVWVLGHPRLVRRTTEGVD